MDLQDKDTEDHNQRVAEMTVQLARLMGMAETDLVHIRRGACCTTSARSVSADAVLLKTGALTDTEWLTMREHPRLRP